MIGKCRNCLLDKSIKSKGLCDSCYYKTRYVMDDVCKKKMKASSKKWRSNNKDKIREYNKSYVGKNELARKRSEAFLWVSMHRKLFKDSIDDELDVIEEDLL